MSPSARIKVMIVDDSALVRTVVAHAIEKEPLIEVIADSAYYLKSNKPQLMQLFSIAKAIATGEPPKAGDAGELDRRELAQGPGRKAS